MLLVESCDAFWGDKQSSLSISILSQGKDAILLINEYTVVQTPVN